MMNAMTKIRNGLITLLALGCLALIAACSPAPEGVTVHDPYEPANRAIHSFNKGLDQVALRPASKAYDAVLPDPVEQGISNFAANLSLPGKIVNHLLQGEFNSASMNAGRFLVNSTFGLGGFLDPAKFGGAPEIDTDFGETLHVWGVDEGAYVELPFLGPSTERDAVGWLVDLIFDPLGNVLPSDLANARSYARGGEILQTRHSLGSILDTLLYESADSYAQGRISYLQNRRFSLGGANEGEDDGFIDPYEDF